MKKRLCLLALAILAALTMACQRNEQGIEGAAFTAAENRPAPEIVVSDLNGGSLRLSQLKGKVVLLNFWATWCPPCREEIPSMMRLNASMAGKPFQMVAVSLDEGGKTAIEEFFRAHGFLLPAYTDAQGKAASVYGVSGVPETFVIDKSGIVVKKIIGPLAWDAPDTIAFLEDLMKK
ncbi:TlpA family protein disulfide reductase [Pelobacter propionicus]|uniref:Redoxin domain protein n=1 Tax=Pelobacter propionicus (strain DSM 2379 / NBRC 103807 / OttBd1) TaxID=338966 RepID=A1AQJ4_PELPD|nr:TlpA disulfide reductase family protein [Pelobacter propionicus]ABK99614.1 Redoxin domain protein [Pelobacter propionicus DSM 2379]